MKNNVKDKILELTKQGMRQVDISRTLGVSRSHVYRTAGSKRKFRGITKEDKELIWKLRGEETSTNDIAKITGISKFSVCKVAREKFPDLIVKPSGRVYTKKGYPPDLISKVKDLAKRHSSMMSIAKAIGTTRYVVEKIVTENDIFLSKPKRRAKKQILAVKQIKKRKPEVNKEEKEPTRLKSIDPIKGKVKLRIDSKTEVYVFPDQLENAKRKYNLI